MIIVILVFVGAAGVALHQFNQLCEEKDQLKKEVERLKRLRHIRLKYLGKD